MSHLLGFLRAENGFADRRSRYGVDTRGELLLAQLRFRCRRVDNRIKQAIDVLGLDALDGLFLGDQAFLGHITAILKVATGVRFPTRVCNIYNVPSSTVNSMSCMSR